MSRIDSRREWELPRLKETIQMPALDNGSASAADFWSVKFYPYTEPGLDPVFAVVGGRRILVCRTPSGKENSTLEVIQEIIDEEKDADYFTCAWSKDAHGTPLLCVAGGSHQLKVFNALTGEKLRTFSGQGGDINDLAVSPINPYIIASASEDCTVCIWSLDPRHESQPCAAILEGDSHVETVLCLAFHPSGRYLLSGGIDHRINLWTLPVFPDANTGTSIPTRIYYPHFSTSEVHSDIVDCVAWYGDCILSKAANENSIVLWSINNFNSSLPPPPASSAPTTHNGSRDARSSFVAPPASVVDNAITLYTRHLELSIPEGDIMFTRFSLFPGHASSDLSQNPVLAFCSIHSKTYFFDLARLEHFWDAKEALRSRTSRCRDQNALDSDVAAADPDLKPLRFPTDANPRAHPFLVPFQRRNRGGRGGAGGARTLGRLGREASLSESTSSDPIGLGHEREGPGIGPGKIDWGVSWKGWNAKYELGEPVRKMEAHHAEMVKGMSFTGRQVAWSNDGMWCVVVGSEGSIGVLGRWGR